MTLILQLAEFIKESEQWGHRSKWLGDDTMKVYVRRANHVVSPKKSMATLDIAAIDVNEDKQNQGLCTAFLKEAHELNPWEATYVECVHNPILASLLMRHGWIGVTTSDPFTAMAPESYFLPKDMEKYNEEQRLKMMFDRSTNSTGPR